MTTRWLFGDQLGPHFLDELDGDFAQEPRRDREALLAVQPALLGVREVQLALRARDADVAEAPLFLEAGTRVKVDTRDGSYLGRVN